MTRTIFRNGFFAFLAMILVAVALALVLNAPAESSRAASSTAVAQDGDDYVPSNQDPKVVDAQIEPNTIAANTPAG